MNRSSVLPPEIGQKIFPYWKFFHDTIRRFYFRKAEDELNILREEVKKYKNINKGERCFIVANGPSINRTPLYLIENEYKIGVNSSYNTGLNFDYYAICDNNALKLFHNSVKSKLFLSGNASSEYIINKEKYSINPILTRYKSNYQEKNITNFGDIYDYVYGGATVVGFAIQLAYYLGFREIYLLGADCTMSKGHHFDGREAKTFFGAFGEEITDWENKFYSYKIINKFLPDCKIYNSTVGGELEVFERKKLEDVV